MDAKEFLGLTVGKLDDEFFVELKERLLGEYISFSFIPEEKVSKDIFSEKLNDYFEKLEIKTYNKPFEKLLLSYMDRWDELVGRRIAKTPSTKKNELPAPVPRARKYYDKIQEIRKSRQLTVRQLVDYTRIAMCLYSSIIEADLGVISDFEYSTKCLEIDKIITSMKNEKPVRIAVRKKGLFDLTELYCEDTGTFILSMILYYHIKNNEVEGEY